MAEKLCLKWNDFQENISNAFRSFGDSLDFADVTLACEDGEQFEAHKIILATSSPIFQNLLNRNKNTNPIIYMRGVKSADLRAIVDFLYQGEANVFQGDLDSFLAIAQELKLKGLTGKEGETESDSEPKQFLDRDVRTKSKSLFNADQHAANLTNIEKAESTRTVALNSKPIASEDMLDQQVKSMMHKSQNKIQSGKRLTTAAICNVCGKEGHPRNISNHIESNHMEGISIPCSLCQKTFRSRTCLWKHRQTFHQL